MLEVLERTDSFEALAQELGGQTAELDELGTAPPELAARFGGPGCSTDLTAGFERPPLDKAEVESALSAIPVVRWRDRNEWRNLVSPLAWSAVVDPDAADWARQQMHNMSRRQGAFTTTTFPDGYNSAANDSEFDQLVSDTERLLADGDPVRTIGSIFHEAARHGWKRAAQTFVAPMNADVWVSPAARLSDHPTTSYKRKPFHGGIAIEGEVSLVVSPGGSSKSTLLTSCALACATGRQLLHDPPGHARTTLIINAEDCRGEIILRTLAATRHHRLDPSEVKDLHLMGVDDCDGFVLTEIDPATRRERASDQWLAWLKTLVTNLGVRWLIIDPLTSVLPYGANDNGVVGNVMRALKQIAADCKCAITLVAHTRKGARIDVDGAEATLGASAWINSARSAIGIIRPDERACRQLNVPLGQECHIRQVIDLKNNLAAGREVQFYRIVSVPMDNGTAAYPEQDKIAVIDVFIPPVHGSGVDIAAERAVLEALASGAPGQITGSAVPFSPAVSASPRCYVSTVMRALRSHYPELHDSRLKSAAKAALSDLSDKGWIDVQDVAIPKAGQGRGSNTNKGIVVCWSRTPWSADPAPGPFVA